MRNYRRYQRNELIFVTWPNRDTYTGIDICLNTYIDSGLGCAGSMRLGSHLIAFTLTKHWRKGVPAIYLYLPATEIIVCHYKNFKNYIKVYTCSSWPQPVQACCSQGRRPSPSWLHCKRPGCQCRQLGAWWCRGPVLGRRCRHRDTARCLVSISRSRCFYWQTD